MSDKNDFAGYSESYPQVAIIIVNYKGWKDTVECLESLLKSSYECFHIFVVDNGSVDGSLEKLREWAAGDSDLDDIANPTGENSFRQVSKPILIRWIENDGLYNSQYIPACRITVIRSDTNLGFAGGNNLALDFSEKIKPFDYFWFLNNDTVVEHKTLEKYVNSIRKRCETEKIGILGCALLYYHRTDTVQSVGGCFNKWIAVLGPIGSCSCKSHMSGDLRRFIAYPEGASIMVTRAFIETIGQMSEDYFLYFEELDWVTRGAVRGFSFDVDFNIYVFHKHGSSTGSNSFERNPFSYGLFLKNVIVFYKKFYPFLLPVAYLRVLFSFIKLIIKGKAGVFMDILKHWSSGFKKK